MSIPSALHGLIDDAAVFPPGNATLPDALSGHREYRKAWYEPLVGPLLLPASKLPQLAELGSGGEKLRVGLIADTGIPAVSEAIAGLPKHVEITQVEARVPDIDALNTLLGSYVAWEVDVFAEIPIDAELRMRLQLLGPTPIMPKFRTGGLTADLFPTPTALATAIHLCAELGLTFKLTAGLHRAVRHTDPATGFTHHGFGNVLAAVAAAERGASVASLTQTLEITQNRPIAAAIRGMLAHPRPLWAGFGSCSIAEPLADLEDLSLVQKES